GLLQHVVDRQAHLLAKWMHAGLIHGVMNTDNMTIAGHSIDFGPVAFLDAFDPGAVFSSIDFAGRYAYGNQPVIAEWNLARFAESLLPAIMQPAEQRPTSQDDAVTRAAESVVDFRTTYSAAWADGFGKLLGISADDAATLGLVLLEHLAASNTDFTTFFASLEQTARSGQVPYDVSHELSQWYRSEEHTSELQSRFDLVCRRLLEKIKYPKS